MVKNQGTKQRGQRIFGDCWQWETNGQCVKRDNCSFRHDINKRGKVTPSNPSPNTFMQQNERKSSRTRSPRGKSPSGRMARWLCMDYLKGTCNNSFCERWHPPEWFFYKSKSGCRFGEKCSHAHRQVGEQPSKRSKKNEDKSAVAMLKKHELYDRSERPIADDSYNTRQLGCVFQDMEPPKMSSILRKSSDIQKPIQRDISRKPLHVMLTFETKILRSDAFAQVNLISVAPTLPKFEDRTQEETEWQEQGARETAWKLAKSVFKKQRRKTKQHSAHPSENRCLPASKLKPEEREFCCRFWSVDAHDQQT